MLDDGDDDFLSTVDTAEAEALAASRAKRQKVSDSGGSRSVLWQQQQQQKRRSGPQKGGGGITLSPEKRPSSGAPLLNSGACFKCGMEGHWARDCTMGGGGGGGGGGGSEGYVPEKACPCGSGSCSVLTSNTAKNPGRKFYHCPLREEAGGCKFFEWCDNPSPGIPATGNVSSYPSNSSIPNLPCPYGAGSCVVLAAKTGKNVDHQFYRCPVNVEAGGCNFFEWCDNPSPGISVTGNVSSYPSDSSIPNLPCPYGAGSCIVLAAKNGKNVGQQFYRCPVNVERGSCGCFKWCNDQISVSSQPTFTSTYNPSSQFSGERNASSCFKCGQGGHWARDCPNSSSDYSEAGTNRVASSATGTCFMCGKAGHWARDCPTPDTAAGAGSRKASNSFSTSYNYK